MGARKVFVLFFGFPLQTKVVQSKRDFCSREEERGNTESKSCTIHMIMIWTITTPRGIEGEEGEE